MLQGIPYFCLGLLWIGVWCGGELRGQSWLDFHRIIPLYLAHRGLPTSALRPRIVAAVLVHWASEGGCAACLGALRDLRRRGLLGGVQLYVAGRRLRGEVLLFGVARALRCI